MNFFRPYHEYFLGLIGVQGFFFFHLIFPRANFFFLYFDRSVFSGSLFDKPNSAIKCLGFRNYVNRLLLELRFDSGLVVTLTLVNTPDVCRPAELVKMKYAT